MAENKSMDQKTRRLHCKGVDQTVTTRKNLRDYNVFPRSVYGAGRSTQFLEHCEIGVLAEALTPSKKKG